MKHLVQELVKEHGVREYLVQEWRTKKHGTHSRLLDAFSACGGESSDPVCEIDLAALRHNHKFKRMTLMRHLLMPISVELRQGSKN